MERAEADDARKLLEGQWPFEIFVDVLVEQPDLDPAEPAHALLFPEDDIGVASENVDAGLVSERVDIEPAADASFRRLLEREPMRSRLALFGSFGASIASR
jgi:hypothetical protein